MATKYGNEVTRTYSGSTRTWRAKMVYSVATYATYVDISIQAWMDLEGGSSTTISVSSSNKCTGSIAAGGAARASASLPSSGSKTVKAGDDWNLVNYTYRVTRQTYSQSVGIGVTVSLPSGSAWHGSSSASDTVSIPALTSYTVAYNANGGTGAIANQTKWYGRNLTLSNGSGISRAHYELIGWNTNAAGTGTHYALGATYAANAGVTLYAEWKLVAVAGDGKADGTWHDGIVHAKVNGEWVIPYAGYTKINGEWIQIKV